MRRWTDEQCAILAEHYKAHGPSWAGWGELLPGRTPGAIREKAKRIGLSERHRHEWSVDELGLLEAVLAELSRMTGKPPAAIARKAVYRAKVSPMLNGRRALEAKRVPRVRQEG